MVAIVAAEQAEEAAANLAATGEQVMRIGRIESGERGCTVRGSAETWSARAPWSATHHHG
jgi:phosphoribosylformylglycinamidine cyclo-ligase